MKDKQEDAVSVSLHCPTEKRFLFTITREELMGVQVEVLTGPPERAEVLVADGVVVVDIVRDVSSEDKGEQQLHATSDINITDRFLAFR
jgi:hypothetical protein